MLSSSQRKREQCCMCCKDGNSDNDDGEANGNELDSKGDLLICQSCCLVVLWTHLVSDLAFISNYCCKDPSDNFEDDGNHNGTEKDAMIPRRSPGSEVRAIYVDDIG